MKNKVIFSNSNASSIRLEYYTASGEQRTKRFDRTSSLVNFCNEHGIEVTIENCITED